MFLVGVVAVPLRLSLALLPEHLNNRIVWDDPALQASSEGNDRMLPCCATLSLRSYENTLGSLSEKWSKHTISSMYLVSVQLCTIILHYNVVIVFFLFAGVGGGEEA